MPHMAFWWLLVQSRTGKLGELACDLVDLVSVLALDHDPDLWLRPGGPHQDPSTRAKTGVGLCHRDRELRIDLPLVPVADGRVYHHLRQHLDLRGRLGERGAGVAERAQQ